MKNASHMPSNDPYALFWIIPHCSNKTSYLRESTQSLISLELGVKNAV